MKTVPNAAQPEWYPTDNAGRIFASLYRWQTTSVFRVSASLTQPVSLDRLETSLQRVMQRFPYFNVHLRQGMFWCFFQPVNTAVPVQSDSIYPCSEFQYRHSKSVPFRVRIYHTRIALEFAHVLTDGTGALTLLRAILAEYLGLNEQDPSELDDWFRPDQTPQASEFEDAFRRYYRTGLPPMERREKAFQFPGTFETRGKRHITTGIVKTKDLLTLSRQKQVTIGEFVMANYLYSLLQAYHHLTPSERKRFAAPIRIDVPVNLRTHLPSDTMRNFFLPAYPEIDPRLGNYSFDEVLHAVHYYMKSILSEKYFIKMLGRNVGATQNPFLKSVPLVIKNLLLPEIYSKWSLSQASSGISNLGRITMPESIEHKIDRFDFIPAYPSSRGISCGMVSYQDSLHICFNRIFTEPIIERFFFRNLAGLGLDTKIETNQPNTPY